MEPRHAHFDEWREKLEGARMPRPAQKRYDVVVAEGPAILAMYPEYVDEANVYMLMADADKAKGDAKSEAAILTSYEHEGGQMPAVLKRLAALEESREDRPRRRRRSNA